MPVPTAAHAETSSTPEAVLKTELRDGVATLTLARPQARNSLSEAMMAALTGALAEIARDDAVRAVVLTAEGPVFSAGHDLKEIQGHRGDADRGRAYFEDVLKRCSTLMTAIVRLPQPVIAAVEGMATAAGCQLVASCDLAVAGADARFCTPGVNIGLFCHTPMVALTRNLAPKHALEMLLLGEWVLAEDAYRMGLVNRVVERGAAVTAATELAGRIAAKSQVPVKLGKAAFYAQAEMGLDDAYAYASRVMTENMLARDADEGISAVLAKRAPQWEDR
ncbi:MULTISPECIES: enoyl-CoA hydratase [unclassified Xanthobacter]|uniref:enoyl-CoA hydratase n=1 Tax=unclassified Xanthobacter TaxID=2623496 RepID=UPI001EDDF09B|nr:MULTISPECIES: enoyl-CoA hydratase [unclassified Xanthobacter]